MEIIGSGEDCNTLQSRQESGLSVDGSSLKEDGELDFNTTYPFFSISN